MKLIRYIKMGALLIYLSLYSVYLLAQQSETAVHAPTDSARNATGNPVSADIIQPVDSIGDSAQTRSCVTTFTNQTVSSYLVVTGCSTLTVQTVTVANSGNLVLSAPGVITINGAFEVALGGQLNVNTTTLPPPPPPGNTMSIAINIGTFGAPFQYTDTKNTAVDYTNDYVGQPTNDVFYTFTLTSALTVTIKHCDSSVGTYVHLLNSSGTSLANNGGYSGVGACSNSAHAYLRQYLSPGTYYLVSEGFSANGSIKTSVTGETPQNSFTYTYDASGNRITRAVVP